MSKKLKTQYNQKSFLPTEVNTETYEKILKQNNFTGRTIGQVLDIIRTILDNTEKGNKFEKLTQWALPLIKDTEIESVHAPRGQDIGVDLIATDNNNNKIAIQCKFYTTSNITRGDIHAFAAGAKEKQINTKWLVCAASGVSDTAMKYIKDYEIKIIDLRKYRDTILTHKPSPVREPFDLQEDAINAVVAGFTNAKPGIHGDRRGKLIMACGTGKTFTVLRIAERLVERKANLLFIAPSIALVAQARKEWLDHTTRPLRTLIICSDNTTRYNEDIQPNEITGRVTTKPAEIAEAMTKKIDDGHAQAVFCTYQSLNKLHEAQAKHNAPKFDLAIIDEAHRTTGLLKEDDADKYMLIHDAIKIKADKRLYMTATPRIYKASAARRRAEKDPSIAVVDMDDTTRYGNQFYHLTFKQAVNAEILCDYRVIALGVTEAVIGHQLTNTLLNLNNEIDDNSNTRSKRKSKGADAQSVLALGAISLAINGFIKGPSHPDSIPRTIAYANNIRRSRWLERALQESGMKSWVTKTGRRDSGTAKARKIDAKHLDGTSSATARHSALDWLSGGSSSEPRLITNAQLFTEGVDVPALNAIAFLDPRESKIGTVQAVGRVMRRDPDNQNRYNVVTSKKWALLLLAFCGCLLVLISQRENINDAIKHTLALTSLLGIAIACISTALNGLGMPCSLKWGADTARKVMPDNRPAHQDSHSEQYFTILGDTAARTVSVPVFILIGLANGEQVHDLGWIGITTTFAFGIVGVGTGNILYRFANLKTTNLGINALNYTRPALALIWLGLASLITVAHVGLLVSGIFAIILANLLINTDIRSVYHAIKPHQPLPEPMCTNPAHGGQPPKPPEI